MLRTSSLLPLADAIIGPAYDTLGHTLDLRHERELQASASTFGIGARTPACRIGRINAG
jgi:hypothetical protein